MEDDFQSLNKGVFVIPFRPAENEAGPSRLSRPLKRVYDESYDLYERSYVEYEKARTEEQLDDIADWLDNRARTPLLKRTSGINRVSVAVMQNMADALPSRLATLGMPVHTLQAKEAGDLSSAIRSIALGYIGDSGTSTKKSGKSGMDEIDDWYAKQKDRSPLLLHIQQAQSISPGILAELLYILGLHPQTPFRVLLSVSSTALFLSSWSHIEPSLIDLTVVQAGKGRKRGSAVNAILKSSQSGSRPPISISDDLADDLRQIEEMTGGGAASALKALKWSLLQHSYNSPLARIAEDHPDEVQAIVTAVKEERGDVPGRELLQLQSHPDLISTLDPAPRLSILHALSQPGAFVPDILEPPRDSTPTPTKRDAAKANGNTPTPRQKRRRKSFTPEVVVNGTKDESNTHVEGGDLRELETLFGLWRSAGRNVNLWDWLEGFRATMLEPHRAAAEEGDEADKVDEGEESQLRRNKRKQADEEEANGEEDDEYDEDDREGDEETQDRLHAAFIRFCEEARMMGLVRARGGRTAKRSDEVVKGIGLV